MNKAVAVKANRNVPAILATPAVTSPIDADVDIEVLRSVPKQFAVEDEDSANWLVKKIVATRQYAERVKAWAELEQRRAQREESTLLFLFGRQIEKWSSDQIAKLHNRKSLNLPAGVVGFRTINAALQIDDEAAVLEWANEHCPIAVVTTPKLSRSILKDHFERTGEVPDAGAHIEPQCERFYIK